MHRCHTLQAITNRIWPSPPRLADPVAAVLLVAKRSQIIANHIYAKPPLVTPVASGSGIVSVDFDRATSRIFWADATQKKIWSSFENGTEKREVPGRQAVLSSAVMSDMLVMIHRLDENHIMSHSM